MNIEVLSHDEPATQAPEETCGNAEQRTGSEDDSSAATNTPDAVLRRICRRSDFPAMSAAINAINREALSDTSHIQHLSSAILKDFALTNKILRVANSALYRRCGAGTISTISRGIVVLGFDTIRQIALSLMLLEHMRNKQHADALIEDFVHAAMSGVIGKRFAAAFDVQVPEASFICSLLHNLGRLLTHCYLPDETQAIARSMAQEQCDEETAASRTLGISYQDLGISIARDWGFPDVILHSMKRLPAGRVARVHTAQERLRVLCVFSNEVSTAFRQCSPEARPREFKIILTRFSENILLEDQDLNVLLKESNEEITELLRALGINLSRSHLGRQLLTANGETPKGGAVAGDSASKAANGPAASGEKTAVAIDAGADCQAALAAGIQDISHALAESDSPAAILQIILETIYRAMGFKRVLLCLRNGAGGTMSARFGFGANAEEAAERFRFTIGGRSDIFNIILASDKDVLINDVLDAKIAHLIPDWFKLRFPVQTFIAFPIKIKGAPVAMIYADKDYADSIAISDKDLPLLRTLCNQAVLAIRQLSDHR